MSGANNSAINNGRDPETGQFLVGHSGNGGRKPGSRNKLAGEFIDALYADFQKNGAEVISRVAKEQPHHYLKVIAAILPKELEIALHLDSNVLEEARNFHEAWLMARKTLGIDHDPLLVEAERDNGS
jgi:hypothetical protein